MPVAVGCHPARLRAGILVAGFVVIALVLRLVVSWAVRGLLQESFEVALPHPPAQTSAAGLVAAQAAGGEPVLDARGLHAKSGGNLGYRQVFLVSHRHSR